MSPRTAHRPLLVSVSRTGVLDRTHRFFEEWCRGRSALGRAVLVLWFVWVGCHHLADPNYTSLFNWLNFGIHEIGHVVTRPFVPHFLYVAAGTIVQYAVPVFAVFMFIRQDDYFAAFPVCSAWIATNLYHTAWYVADARTQNIPTAPIFGEPTTSDWTYMLGRLGILSWDAGIAAFLRVLAFGFMWTSVLLGAYMVWLMLTRRERHGLLAG